MNYQDFLQYVETQVSQILGEEAHVSIHKIIKNNGICYDALSILEQKEGMAPSIYLNDYYEEYKEGKTLNQIMRDILDDHKTKKFNEKIDAVFFKEFSKVSDKIAYKLVNYALNKELLNEIPHIKLLDLAIIFYCVLQNEDFEFATIIIYNSHLKLWKTTTDEILVYARNNTPHLLPGTFRSMDNVMKNMLTAETKTNKSQIDPISKQIIQEINVSEDLAPMYILSNTDMTFGAIVILYEGVLALIAEHLNSDLYILPSSVHECIIVPFGGNYTKATLREMVTDINRTQVAPVEVLSNSVYTYMRGNEEINT